MAHSSTGTAPIHVPSSGISAVTVGSPSNGSMSSSGQWISSLVAGSIGGGCGLFVGYPFDSLKVRMQVGQSLQYTRFDWHVLRQLYRGVSTPLLTVGTISALNFSLFEYCKRVIENEKQRESVSSAQRIAQSLWLVGDALDAVPLDDEIGVLSNSSSPSAPRFSTVFSAGVASGVASTFITNPLSIIKIRMQVASEEGIFSVCREVFRVDGLRTFFRGYPAHLVSESFGRGVYLWTYEFVKAQVHHVRTTLRAKNENNASSLSLSDYFYAKDTVLPAHCDGVSLSTRVVAAASAGIFSWLSIYPCDVIKARVQLDLQRNTYRSVAHCVAQTLRAEGVRGLFRGLSYTLVRAGPVAGTVLPIYDLAKSAVERQFST